MICVGISLPLLKSESKALKPKFNLISSTFWMITEIILTYSSVDQAGNDCYDYEYYIPVMVVFDSRRTQHHEDNSLCHTTQHFQEILDGGLWLFWDVEYDILFHHNTTESQSENKAALMWQ